MEVIIENNFSRNCIEIYAFESDGLTRKYLNIDLTGNISVNQIGNEVSSSPQNPMLRIPMQMVPALFKAIADFNLRRGIVSENENLLQGKLAATQNHLEDMRKLAMKFSDFALAIQNVPAQFNELKSE